MVEITEFDDVPTATMQDIVTLKGWEWEVYELKRDPFWEARITREFDRHNTYLKARRTYRARGDNADAAMRQAFTYFMNAEGKNT